jgi:transposase
MAYREVTMTEIKEVLRQWMARERSKRIARRLGLDPKTVRRYVRVAERCGLAVGMEAEALSEEKLSEIAGALGGMPGRSRGPTWELCERHREWIAEKLRDRVKLSKIRRLLARQGVCLAQADNGRFVAYWVSFVDGSSAIVREEAP